MATVSRTGHIAFCELGDPHDRDALAQAQFLKLVEKLKARPSVVYVKRPSLERALDPLCRMLETRPERVGQLVTLDPARESLERFSRLQGRGG